MDNMVPGIEIIDFRCCFAPPNQIKFVLGSSRNFNLFCAAVYSYVLLNLLPKMKAVRRHCISLMSGKCNVFAHRELLEHTINYNNC